MRSRLLSSRVSGTTTTTTTTTWSFCVLRTFRRRCHAQRLVDDAVEDSIAAVQTPVLFTKYHNARDALYIKDERTAVRVVDRLEQHLRLKEAGPHRFVEINPGPGHLTKQLLERFPNLRLRCAEVDESYRDSLTAIASSHPGRAELTFLDFFRVFRGGPSLEGFATVDETFGRKEGLREKDGNDDDDDVETVNSDKTGITPNENNNNDDDSRKSAAAAPPATLFGVLPPYVKTTPALSRVIEATCDAESVLGRYADTRFLIALPFARVPVWMRDSMPLEDEDDDFLLSQPFRRHFRMSFDKSFVLVQYFFHARPLMAFPLSSLINAEKRDVGRVLIEFVAKDPSTLSIHPRHWKSLSFFVEVLHTLSASERLIPAMETFVPDIGPALIMDDYGMMETIRDLSPARRVHVYTHVLRHPAFAQSIFGQVDSGRLTREQWFALTVGGRKGRQKISFRDD